MAYLENSSDYIYYNDSSAYGNYQFVSLRCYRSIYGCLCW